MVSKTAKQTQPNFKLLIGTEIVQYWIKLILNLNLKVEDIDISWISWKSRPVLRIKSANIFRIYKTQNGALAWKIAL